MAHITPQGVSLVVSFSFRTFDPGPLERRETKVRLWPRHGSGSLKPWLQGHSLAPGPRPAAKPARRSKRTARFFQGLKTAQVGTPERPKVGIPKVENRLNPKEEGEG